MIDTYRGTLRVRKWPEKRGSPPPGPVQMQNAWFRAVNDLTKRADPEQVKIAMEATRHSGLYPRDLLMRTISEGILDMVFPDGRVVAHQRRKVERMAFNGARVVLASNFALLSTQWNPVSWGVADLDPSNFWSIGNPQWLIVPGGVTVARFDAAISIAGGSGSAVFTRIVRDDGTVFAEQSESGNIRQVQTLSTGPIPVANGDGFRLEVFPFSAETLLANPSSYLAATVLGTS